MGQLGPQVEVVEIATPYLATGFEVGDMVTSGIKSRDLFVKSDKYIIIAIERVRLDFVGQKSELKIVRRRDVRL